MNKNLKAFIALSSAFLLGAAIQHYTRGITFPVLNKNKEEKE